MERKGILYLFTVPVSLFFYALWLCWRVGDAPISDNVEMFRWALAYYLRVVRCWLLAPQFAYAQPVHALRIILRPS